MASLKKTKNWVLRPIKMFIAGQKGSILQNFRPSLSYRLSLRSLFCLFLSGRLRQGLLYSILLVTRPFYACIFGCLVIFSLPVFQNPKHGKPFNEVIRANIGDCHATGQKPNTFIRQVNTAPIDR